MKDKIKNTLLWLWQLPQNIIGLAVYKYYKGYEACTKELCGDCIKCKISSDISGGISLGDYIIVNNLNKLQHELGHCKQSKILGPFYLLVIGLPSVMHAAVHKSLCKNKDYYHFYTEKWANKLMKINE